MTIIRCQYCGEQMNLAHITRHERTCLDSPVLLAELRRLLDDGTGRCIRRKLYMDMVYRPVSSEALVRRWGSWDASAVALGLAIPDKQPKVGLNAPLTDAERFCCQRRAVVEGAWHK